MEMNPLSIPGARVPQAGSAAGRDHADAQAGLDQCDTVSFTSRDLSPKGTLTLIIQIKGEDRNSPFREECKKCGLGRFKEELEIINGFTFEITPSNLQKFFSLLPENVEISVDRPVSFFPGMPGGKR